ncbi:MAG: 3-isopropylmalate dehydrogenase [Planctomycetes bacterium]|nr:3-isopropylmalate dehydrogenase [Planctomycetota bacterium]
MAPQAEANKVEETPLTIGLLPGEGIGPEMIAAAKAVLQAVESITPQRRFQLLTGGAIGDAAVRECGTPLSPAICDFCKDVFARKGAILAGAGGGRFVYDVRQQFDLYYKLNPLVPSAALDRARRFQPRHTEQVDILVVRENSGGIYQGCWGESKCDSFGRLATHKFQYNEHQVRRVLHIAAGYAQKRRGELTLVFKPNGIPTVSQLWSDCARELATEYGIKLRELEIDYACFHMIHDPWRFDVIVTPNLFGDIVSDIGGVLLGSRGLCYGASYSAAGEAVYQTNHGAAHDLAGTDRANPVGQIFSLAMMLRLSFGLAREARLIEAAVEQVWSSGTRTEDVQEPGCRIVGTREMADCIAAAVWKLSHEIA